MKKLSRILGSAVIVFGVMAGVALTAQSPAVTAVTFHKDVEPILQRTARRATGPVRSRRCRSRPTTPPGRTPGR